MKPGTTVKHKNGETYTLLKVNGDVAVCRRLTPEHSKFGNREIWTVLCLVENLSDYKRSVPTFFDQIAV